MIHLVGLPHTEFDADKYSSCAFTAKAVRLTDMIRETGREVVVYWGMPMGRREEIFGEYSPNALPVIEWDANLHYWVEFHERVIGQIRSTIKPDDIVAVVGGAVSQCVVDAFSTEYTCIEPGVGYEGLCRDTFACFESYAWMHNRYGAMGIGDGRAFDVVIPNAVNPAEWSLSDSGGYALFVGRLIARKGPHVAAQIAKAAGLPLVLAGAGVASLEPGRIVATDGTVVEGDVTHVGAVTGEDRRWLFARAEVLICPTLYIGPWEGVHAEAMMSGVGVVAPDYGVFTETVYEHYRYRTLSQAVDAVFWARETRGLGWRDRAIDLYSTEVCTRKYDAWLDRIESLRDGRNGWYG